MLEYQAFCLAAFSAPTATTFGWSAGKRTLLVPSLPAAATTSTPAATARSIALAAVWLKEGLLRLRLMTLTGRAPFSV